MRCMKVFSDGYVWIADIGHEVTKHFLDISRHFLASLDTSKHHMSTSAQKFSRHLWTPCIVFKSIFSAAMCYSCNLHLLLADSTISGDARSL